MHKEVKKTPSKERIIQAAVQLFARQGFAGTGLRELAAQADVNLAMVNYFFGSKKELLKEILDGFLAGYLAIAKQELAGTDNLYDKLSRFIGHAVHYFESHQDALLVTITELPHDDHDIIAHKASWARQMAAILEKEVCQVLNRKTGQNIPATCIGPMLTSLMASRFLFTPVMEHVRGTSENENPVDIHSYTEMIISLFLHGIERQKKMLSQKIKQKKNNDLHNKTY